MKIEIGKSYMTRDGRKAEVTGRREGKSGRTYIWQGFVSEDLVSWTDDGHFDVDTPNHSLDLVALWRDKTDVEPETPAAKSLTRYDLNAAVTRLRQKVGMPAVMGLAFDILGCRVYEVPDTQEALADAIAKLDAATAAMAAADEASDVKPETPAAKFEADLRAAGPHGVTWVPDGLSPSTAYVIADRVRAEWRADEAKSEITKQSVLEEAIATVAGRGKSYGRPEDNFERIARLWTAHLVNRYADGEGGDTAIALPKLDPQDVAMMMTLMKIARLENDPAHHDSWVDVAGYGACGGEIAGRIVKNDA